KPSGETPASTPARSSSRRSDEWCLRSDHAESRPTQCRLRSRICILVWLKVLLYSSLNSIIFLPDALNLMQRRVDVRFGAEQLRKRDFTERVVDDLVQLDDHRTNAAVACVHARVEDACVALAVRLGRFAFEDSYYLVQPDLGSWSCQRVTTLDAAGRLHESGLGHDPHQLPGVRGGNSLEAGK